jgi:hypothetical protein
VLRTNLATRPFYNDRAVRLGIALGIALVAALTAFNVLQVLSLNARNSEMTMRAQQAEEQTAKFREQARVVTQQLTGGNVDAVQAAAREANLLIERRVFSWTDLFNRFESTLPADVRISAVQPQIDREGRLLIEAVVIARRIEDLNEFMDRLEISGGLRDVLARQDLVLEDGTLSATVQGYYEPAAAPAGPAGPEGQSGNASPAAGNVTPPEPRGDTR